MGGGSERVSWLIPRVGGVGCGEDRVAEQTKSMLFLSSLDQ